MGTTPLKKPVVNRYATFLQSRMSKGPSDEEGASPDIVIQRLHSDVHGMLDSIEHYIALSKDGRLLRSAKEICVVAHDPFLAQLRFAFSKRFPDGRFNAYNLLADPLAAEVLRVMDLRE